MKVHLGCFRVVMAAAVVAGVSRADAQYAPYRPAPQATPGYYPAVTPPGTVAAGQPATYPQPQQQQQPMGPTTYQPAVQPQYQPAQQGTYGGYPAQTYPAQSYTAQAYPSSAYPTYPTVAQQPTQALPVPTPPAGKATSETLPPQPGMTAPPTTMVGPANGAGGMAVDGHHNAYPQAGQPGCNNYGSAYPSTGQDYGLSGYFNNDSCNDTQWFGGLYVLYMERDNASFTRVTVMADPPVDPYYPPAATTVLSSMNVDYQYREGLEVRFGSTFRVSSGCDTGCNGYGSNCGSCAPSDLYAWEAAFWAIDRDVDWFQVTDDDMTDTNRIYGMINYAGLDYDDGTGSRMVNDYYDYQMPIVDDNPAAAGDYRVNSQRIRTNFRASNFELNFLRIPVCNVSSCGSSNCGNGYAACSNGYGAGCQTPSCEASSPAFSMAALCGVRYFRMDDDFEHAVDAWESDGAGGWSDTGYVWDMFSDYNIDNNLVGFQLGTNMNYCVACKWNVFADASFGLYNNHITQYARIYGPNGNATDQDGNDAVINNDKDDIAFLGEMRLGGSYDLSCNWRAVLAYRAVAISGVALSMEQVNTEMSNWAEASRIDSNGSVIIHGVQAGVECRY